MGGQPIASAVHALISGLNMLTPMDEFTVVAFNHEHIWWSQMLLPATAENVQAATGWANAYVQAGGLTDIMAPLSGVSSTRCRWNL